MSANILIDMGGHLPTEYMTKNAKMPYLHIHPQWELYFCPRPQKQHIVLNTQEWLYDGSCIVITAPFNLHSMSSAQEGEYFRIVMYYDAEEICSLAGGEALPGNADHASMFYRLTQEQADSLLLIAELIAHPDSNFDAMERKLALGLLLKRLRHLCSGDSVRNAFPVDDYMQQVCRYISVHFSEDLHMEEIARQFSVSRSKLNRDFNRYLHCTFHEFWDHCRLNQAKWLVLYSKQSINEIARSCGFENISYFYTFFKKHMSVSPLGFKRLEREKRYRFDTQPMECSERAVQSIHKKTERNIKPI